jgi:hypothetical protein
VLNLNFFEPPAPTAPANPTGKPYTSLADGRLRGWVRLFMRKGFFISVESQDPADPRPYGEPPSLEEWAAFDEEAARQGVGGYVAMLRKNAIPKHDFFEKATAEVANAVRILDQTVPGWATLIDALGPMVPVIPIITSAIAWAAKLSPVITQDAFKLLGTVVAGKPAVYQAPSAIQNEMATWIGQAAQGSVNALAPIRGTLIKFGATVATTKGDLEDKLLAASKETLSGVLLCIQVGCLAASAATAGAVLPACAGLQALAGMLQAGVSVITAREAAKKAKELAKQVRQEAEKEARELDDEARKLQAEIDRLRRLRGQLARKSSTNVSGTAKAAALIGAALVLGKVLR